MQTFKTIDLKIANYLYVYKLGLVIKIYLEYFKSTQHTS